ncbi:hypothetical protein PAXRUDRAFT_369679 [Paxillus rubicundulus Ve08.2h10]|uniref:C3H1-type domain-containing protein n=1 Tax=Paxillus rubicundulus Ve08.2h10 TaxID=930991 RepID=A0A0D0DRH5_9AGAM|nr:hypothetical protein PAXRUDRAFT_369679 [Paxillus rubicundulus Ve08.2h10]
MQKVVTSTAAPTNSLYIAGESASSISFPTRVQPTGVLGWTQTRETQRLTSEIGQEKNWNLSAIQDSPTSLSSNFRRPSLLAIQKLSTMPARTNLSESSSYTGESNRPSDRHMVASNTSNRWRFNGTGQLIDAGVASEWDLAQDIARLKLGSVGELADEVHGPLTTPPQSKLGTAAVVQYNEASPLETASEASVDSSPQVSDHQISPSHSRVSSADSHESALSSASHTLRGPPQLKIATGGEAKERPHSFSGGISAADLRRLQQAGEESVIQPGANTFAPHQWSSSHYRDLLATGDKPFSPDQPTYPSLASAGAFGRNQQQYDYRALQGPVNGDLQADYAAGQRNFFPPPQGMPGAPQHFVPGRPTDSIPTSYRQPQRGFPPQPLLPSSTSLGYTASHVSHLSLGTTQQLYDMMVPHTDGHHPAVARVQQQHNVFRATHQHSASDPSALRDAATLALLNNPAFAPAAHTLYPAAMAPPALGLYANQFYAAPEGYPQDVAAVVNRIQAQFSGPYGTMPNQAMGLTNSPGSNAGSQSGNGPSANNRKLGLYKTELCRSWEEKGTCRYGAKCQFAHGEEELRVVARHPKYKTEICRTFWVSGACPYGKRCCFIHTELPVTGVSPGADGVPPPSGNSGSRERSNSDPNESSISLLQRIQRKNEATPVDVSPPSGGFFSSRPPTGSLRVDTSTLSNITKQNKSAYPTFASNALMLSNPEQSSMKSPVPLTAGPDLGRHNASRLDIVGYSQASSTNPSARHSFNGTDVDLDFSTPSTPSAPNQVSSFTMASAERASANNGIPRSHARSGSAGNWGNVTRSSNLTAAPSYPQSLETNSDAPWSTSELAVGSAKLTEGWM